MVSVLRFIRFDSEAAGEAGLSPTNEGAFMEILSQFHHNLCPVSVETQLSLRRSCTGVNLRIGLRATGRQRPSDKAQTGPFRDPC